LNTKTFFILTNLSCVFSDQNSTTINNFRTCQCLICWYGPYYFTPFQRLFISLAFTLYLLFAEETLVNQPVDCSSLQHASNPNSPRVQISSPQAETSNSPRIQSPLSQVEAPISPGMNPSSTQPEASNLPGILPASPYLEASALPGTPQAPSQLITQELPLEPKKIPSPIQETRNEVGVNICTFISI
jgi:hypothetical protein